MQKYKLNRKLVEVECDQCHCMFQKPESEYKRSLKLGRHNFCTRRCAVIYSNSHRKPTEKLLKTYSTIKQYAGNQRDEYTPFRYILRSARNRFKECNLTLEYLQELWESQNHICPYTGLELVLPSYTKKVSIENRASLDRIDSSKGYVIGNVQFVSTPINFLKGTMSDTQTKEYLKKIAQFLLS